MKDKIDHTSNIPLHIQAEGLLRRMIASAEFQQDKLIPNEVELSDTLGISRNTLRQAINKLVFEGLLIRKKGVGTKIADKKIIIDKSQWDVFLNETNKFGEILIDLHLNIIDDAADDIISQLFSIPLDKKIIKLERICGVRNEPEVITYSWFHPRLKITGKEDFSKPIYEIFEKQYSIKVVLFKDEISANFPKKKIAEKLDISKKDLVLIRKRSVFDEHDKILEFSMSYFRADRFVYKIDIKRPQ
jgi:GntR family transcriptional regulator